MWDEEANYCTPRYLLWACIGLGGIMGLMGAGAIITVLITSDVSGYSLASLVLLLVQAFVLVSIGAKALQDAPNQSLKGGQ